MSAPPGIPAKKPRGIIPRWLIIAEDPLFSGLEIF
jgi:hypothetical protein